MDHCKPLSFTGYLSQKTDNVLHKITSRCRTRAAENSSGHIGRCLSRLCAPTTFQPKRNAPPWTSIIHHYTKRGGSRSAHKCPKGCTTCYEHTQTHAQQSGILRLMSVRWWTPAGPSWDSIETSVCLTRCTAVDDSDEWQSDTWDMCCSPPGISPDSSCKLHTQRNVNTL